MNEHISGKYPVPICEEGLRGIANNRLITDVIAPELMDVGERVQVTYLCYRALHVNPHKSEYGFATSRVGTQQVSNQPGRVTGPQRLLNLFFTEQ